MTMRVTMNCLADELKRKLESLELKGIESVTCNRTYARGCDLEAGAARFHYSIKFYNSRITMSMFTYSSIKEIENYLKEGKTMRVIPTRFSQGRSLMDASFDF